MNTEKVLHGKAENLRQFAKVHDENFKRAGISAADALRMAAMMIETDFANYQNVFFGEESKPIKTQKDVFIETVELILKACGSCKATPVCKWIDLLKEIRTAGRIPPEMLSRLPDHGNQQCDGQNFLFYRRNEIEGVVEPTTGKPEHFNQTPGFDEAIPF